MLEVLALAAVAALLVLAATATAATKRLAVGDNWFARPAGVPRVTIHRGDAVVWRWRGHTIHNVHVARGPARFTSPTKSRGTWRRKFNRRGRYVLICTIHGGADQKMVLKVR